ncbi:MAG: AraC family transcriptional regulator [Lachnospiraceae bacterium]|nr:AraC family transcriptional regulator [Lachnospiraceae bacterium]
MEKTAKEQLPKYDKAPDIINEQITNGQKGPETYRQEAEAIEKILSSVSEDKKAFSVLDQGKDAPSLYRINAPYQITYEYCSGEKDDDYLNILTLYEAGSMFHQESVGLHNRYHFINRPPHYHDYYEFMIVLESSIIQQIEGNNHTYPAGSCCLINRNLCHKEYYYPGARVLYIGLSLEMIKELFGYIGISNIPEEKNILDTEMYRFISYDLKYKNKQSYLDFIPLYSNRISGEKLKTLTDNIIHRLMFPSFGSSYVVKGMLCEILSYISSPLNYHCTTAEINVQSDRLIFSRISHLLEENDGRLSRKELSDILNYSGDYINRIVNKYSGRSLHEYAMGYTIKKAALCLQTTDMSVSEIAASLGFTNRTYFYRLFSLRYGSTPVEYRKRHSIT